ncbi:class I SAM-dependent methyltransferase [Nostoc sp. FACHB-110]|uniref:class I SAM-dependent methyltransferase n=1 Tax=Nostoc sp. FACHB-110 TaxID=2692834 RepID=UPI0016826063|nr:class I SAM-dependent methyltransferase [Nostoc sp. FACHB-110]MBD2437587.1 class I SAM-dependent methyltransferase [Nostoc sp. FACHB-110]
MVENTDKAWNRYGELDPYFGVLSSDKYQSKNLNEDSYREFFQSGINDFNSVIATVQKHIDPHFQPRYALEFGCGVGRILIPLAKSSIHVVGLDVSESMLAEARKNCQLNKLQNVELLKSDDSLTAIAGRKFNFIYSFIVFQHISPRRGEAIMANIIKHLESNGVGVLHFTYHQEVSKLQKTREWIKKYIPFAHNLINLIKCKDFNYPLMLMNQYDLNRLFLRLHKSNIHNIYVEMSNHGGHLGVILYFQLI